MAETFTILVTGGTGLVGNGVKHYVESTPELQKHKWIFLSSKDGDLTSEKECTAVFEKHRPTHVLHLAARVGGLFANMSDNIGFFRDNLKMNDNIVELCAKHDVKRGVFCLSTCVFPDGAPLPLTEEIIHNGPPHHSNEGYSYAKRMLEVQTRLHRKFNGRDFVCVIPTNLYGTHDNYHLQNSHVIPGLMHKLYLAQQSGQPFTVMGSGKPLRQFLFSWDAGKIFVDILLAPREKVDFSSVILCGDEENEYEIREVADALIKAFDFKGEVKYDTSKADGQFKKTASNKKLRSFLPSGLQIHESRGRHKDFSRVVQRQLRYV